MKKKLTSVLSAALLASVIFSGSAFAATTTTAHVNNTVNFRDRPSTDGDVYGYIKSGIDVPVTEVTNDYWLRVSYNGRQGYISRGYVTLSGSAPAPQPTQQPAPQVNASALASKIIAYGKTLEGVRYQWGGNSPSAGFDCSGFVHYIFDKYGVNVTRQSKASAENDGYTVSRSNLRPGDLVYFYSPIHHVAVYIGNGQLLHTYGAGGVRISDFSPGSFWYRNFTTAKRVLN